jgi:hypothetical protein
MKADQEDQTIDLKRQLDQINELKKQLDQTGNLKKQFLDSNTPINNLTQLASPILKSENITYFKLKLKVTQMREGDLGIEERKRNERKENHRGGGGKSEKTSVHRSTGFCFWFFCFVSFFCFFVFIYIYFILILFKGG